MSHREVTVASTEKNVGYFENKRYMYRLAILFTLLLPIKGFSQDRIIVGWDLFKNDKPTNAERQAVLNCGIVYGYRVRPDKGNLMQVQFDVKVGIDTVKSYFNFDLKNKDYKLLNHEQGHADIVLVYALKLKAIFNQTKFYKTNYNTIIKQIYAKFSAQMHEKQLEYDLETNHGMIDSVQTKWDLYFKKELNIK